jgi:hypothetical protein
VCFVDAKYADGYNRLVNAARILGVESNVMCELGGGFLEFIGILM